jgi:hypothetical protein
MQTTNTHPENLTYGIQLWQLNCLYWDGHNYRFSRHHRAVDPAVRGRIAVSVNQALKRRFAGPDDLCNALKGPAKGTVPPMPSSVSDLRGLLPRGAAVSTFVVSESRTGASCRLLVFAVVQGEIIPLTHAAAGAVELEIYSDQVIVNASRANAGAELVARLARVLHGDPGALHHHSIGEVRA